MDKSKGHLSFSGESEHFARPDGSVWEGLRCYPIGEDGYRKHAYEIQTPKGMVTLFRIGFTLRPKALEVYRETAPADIDIDWERARRRSLSAIKH